VVGFYACGGKRHDLDTLYSQACCRSETVPWPYFPLTLDHDCIPSSKRRESLCQEFHVEIVDNSDASQLVITAPQTLIRLAKTSILQICNTLNVAEMPLSAWVADRIRSANPEDKVHMSKFRALKCAVDINTRGVMRIAGPTEAVATVRGIIETFSKAFDRESVTRVVVVHESDEELLLLSLPNIFEESASLARREAPFEKTCIKHSRGQNVELHLTGERAIIENVAEICHTGRWPDFEPKKEEYRSSRALACGSSVLGYGSVEDLAGRLKVGIRPIRKESDAVDGSTPIIGFRIRGGKQACAKAIAELDVRTCTLPLLILLDCRNFFT